jgi:predicted ATPase
VVSETAWSVQPLALPPPACSPTEAAGYPAVRLFVERARSARPGFAVTPENVGAVAEVCRRLDGIPLALELAAPWLRVLPADDLATRLASDLGLLGGGSRTLPARHRTMRAAITWSYCRLSSAERAFFRRLAVFAGGWTLPAAETVCGEAWRGGGDSGPVDTAVPVLDGLARLVEKSLVVTDEDGGRMRYRLLEPVRQYALERLIEAGEAGDARDRHRAYYLALAETAAAGLHGPDAVAASRRLTAEYDNLRAALRWAIDQGPPAAAWRLAAALGWFWNQRGHLSEGGDWLEQALARGPVDDPGRVPALTASGLLAYYRGEYERAIALAEAGGRLARRNAHLTGTAEANYVLGLVAQYRGDLAVASRLMEASLADHRRAGNTWHQGVVLDKLSNFVRVQGDKARAVELAEAGLACAREVGDAWSTALALDNLGRLALERGEAALAASLHGESLARYRALDAPVEMATALDRLAAIAQYHGDAPRMADLASESLALRRRMGNRWGTAKSLYRLALATQLLGDHNRARVLYAESLAIYQALGSPVGLAETRLGWGQLEQAEGDVARAEAHYRASLAGFEHLGHSGAVECLERLAELALRRHQPARAARLLGAAAALRAALDEPVPPAARPAIERTSKASRVMLGEAAFAAAWAAGQVMPRARAVAEALRDDEQAASEV